ncbi:hypothetical protein HDU85_001935 [Gaertneriomyces sp. JEL0708]|nr:hypothetical protein HDU85_001935 [Gaertneriomyces sp. JEL0708]
MGANGRYNRLKSIEKDAIFVQTVASHFEGMPLVPNERCGSWYIDPSLAHGQSVYFKSTDGHFGKWDFNMRRMNLHLVPTICSSRGCIIVDSTRNGKRMPDALSKTIPIWCCVINNAVAALRAEQARDSEADSIAWDATFHSLPTLVSRNEHEQIVEKIPTFVEKLLGSRVNLASLTSIMEKPLRPIWMTPATTLRNAFEWGDRMDLPFYPVILLNASEVVPDGLDRRAGFTYVQGSADDHELWGEGLDHSLFWEHKAELLESEDAEACARAVERLVETHKPATRIQRCKSPPYHWLGNTGIAVGNRDSGKPPRCWELFDVVVNCGAPQHANICETAKAAGKRYIYLDIPEGKKGQHALFQCLPEIISELQEPLETQRKILLHCMQGKDRSVGIALALLIQFFDHDGRLLKDRGCDPVSKEIVQDRLLFIQSFRYSASPTRATIQKIKTFFLSPGFVDKRGR